MNTTWIKLSLIAGGLVTFAGCAERRAEPATVTTTGSALTVNNQVAVDRFSTERCNREAACNNFGADKKYADKDACLREIKHDTSADLRASECPHGVRSKEFETCIDDVRSQKCDNPVDAVSRLASCRAGAICLK